MKLETVYYISIDEPEPILQRIHGEIKRNVIRVKKKVTLNLDSFHYISVAEPEPSFFHADQN